MNNEIKVMNDDEIRDFCIKKDLKIFELEQEIEKLNNIINELEKDLGLELMKTREPNEYNNGLHNAFGYIKNKLQELKGSDK